MVTNSSVCGKCGWWVRICKCTPNQLPSVHVWKPMYYNDLDVQPVWVESKRQLREECKKRNLVAVRLL